MVSRVFKRAIKDWWDHKVDQFVAKKAAHRSQLISKVHEGILYVDNSDDQYEIFWCKFPEDLYNWLRELKWQSPLSGSVITYHSWTSSGTALVQQLDNEKTRVVYFWVKTTVEGYVVEFVAESYQSYSKVEVVFNSE